MNLHHKRFTIHWKHFWRNEISTRLVTRTKESNMDAKKKSHYNTFIWKEINIKYEKNLAILTFNSNSKHVRTRKMVNYTWSKWSRKKFWWKFYAVLTCKLLVIIEYRGERLIEPSSSWFHLNIPLGRLKWY